MKIFSRFREKLPQPTSVLLAILSAVLLILAFPGFELWFTAWFALVPLFYAVEREKESWIKSLFVGWTFGILFFFGTCWWLTFAPTNYGGIPAIVSYLLLFGATVAAGIFPAMCAGLFSVLLKRFGNYAILSVPFLWISFEFLRFGLTGNIWNSIGYSQAFIPDIFFVPKLISVASIGGVFLVGFFLVAFNAVLTLGFFAQHYKNKSQFQLIHIGLMAMLVATMWVLSSSPKADDSPDEAATAKIVAIQPNVPMKDLNFSKWQALRSRHLELAEEELKNLDKEQSANNKQRTIVIFPESPMNFMYERDEEFRTFLKNFAEKNNVAVLFNSAEPDKTGKQFYNSAVMVNESGEKIAQYDKIHLLPFGEYLPLSELVGQIMPPLVGNFAFGDEYDLLPLGDAKAGVMICFESHFPSLSNEFVKQGADTLIEITNDGYLGNTPVLRQHLASAVFRAVETNRPVLRVTNVGITAYINERGEVINAADVYTEATRVWSVSKSDGKQTFYVRYGDWTAWLCVVITLGLFILSFRRKYKQQ